MYLHTSPHAVGSAVATVRGTYRGTLSGPARSPQEAAKLPTTAGIGNKSLPGIDYPPADVWLGR